MNLSNRTLSLSFAVVSIATLAYPLLFVGEIVARDWRYFNSLSLFVRSSFHHYGLFPLHNPWMCGGLNLLANPENRLFSPMGMLDFLFFPQFANYLSLILFAFAGLWGMYRLLKFYRVSDSAAWIGSVLFISSSWFGLHFSAGHVGYGSFQLLGWVGYFYHRFDSRMHRLGLIGVLSLMLVDGGISAFFLSALLIGSFVLFGFKPAARDILKIARGQWKSLAIEGVIFSFLTSPKTLPVLLEISDRIPHIDQSDVSLEHVGLSLFFPFQRLDYLFAGLSFEFHEFGCYIGILAALLVGVSFFRRGFARKNWRLLALGSFWLWIAYGFLPEINPWNAIWQKIPVLNNVHVQSRTLILFALVFYILLARSIAPLREFLSGINRRHAYGLVIVFLVGEALFVRNFPFHRVNALNQQWIQFDEGRDGFTYKDLITSDRLIRTVDFGPKPFHYRLRNLGSKTCYESAHYSNDVSAEGAQTYRGEAYSLGGKGRVEIYSYTPGRLKLSYNLDEPGEIEVNTSHLGHWKPRNGKIKILSKGFEKLRLSTPHHSGIIELDFSPWYFNLILLLYALGLIFFILMIYFTRAHSIQRK